MLPATPKIGGKGGHGLNLKTDMTGMSGGKKSKPKVAGNLKKNPGKSGGRKRA